MFSTNEFYHTSAQEFTTGQRVAIHPAHDQWMMGNKYGNVIRVGRAVVFVRLDHDAPKRSPRWFHPESLAIVE